MNSFIWMVFSISALLAARGWTIARDLQTPFGPEGIAQPSEVVAGYYGRLRSARLARWSPDMALRLVLLVIIASLIIIGLAPSDHTHGRKRSTPQHRPAGSEPAEQERSPHTSTGGSSEPRRDKPVGFDECE
jgi:hypothetical protein